MNGLLEWDPKIDRLYHSGHRFLGIEYSEPGWLYRGASNGLNAVLESGLIGHFDGEKSFTRLERELEIYLISQDFSDAYSVTRFWEGNRDAYIAVFKSGCFNREQRMKRASVLAFAEPGIVFKYPFLTRPMKVSEVDYLIMRPEDAALHRDDHCRPWPEAQTDLRTRILSPPIDRESSRQRGSYERILKDCLESRGVNSAVACPSADFPKKI